MDKSRIKGGTAATVPWVSDDASSGWNGGGEEGAFMNDPGPWL